jgi:predicted permease
MSTTRDDLRYAVRSMRRNPGFTAVAVATLALGIGVNTAIFSLVDQVLLWRVPARDPGGLVNIEGGRSGTYPFYREYRDRNQVFSGMFASSQPYWIGTVGVRPEGAPAVEVGHVSFVSGNYFPTLGVSAAAGRVLAEADDQKPGGSQVAILAYDYWQRRLGGRLDVIGRKFAVNGYPLEIVGVAEKGFGGVFNDYRADAFIPLTMFPLITPAAAPVWNSPGAFWLSTMARLKPGVSMEKAQAEMRVLWPRVADALNEAAVKGGGKARTYPPEEQIALTPGAHGVSFRRPYAVDPLVALLAATGLVMLIACANIANLLLARAAGRRKEVAVRLAMGATRARLVRQILTESLVLAAMGGAAGLMLAYASVAAMAAANLVPPDLHLRPSLALAAFAAGLTLLTGILAGLAPALRIARENLAQVAQDSGFSSPGGTRVRLGKILIAGQVALSLALLAGAGLFIRTLRNLESVDLGFQRENALVVNVDASKLGYKGYRLRAFYDQLLERARSIPEVRSAGLAGMTPMGGYAMSRLFSAEGYQPRPGERAIVYCNPVSEGYFKALGIPVLLGRGFEARDEPAITPHDNLLAAMGHVAGGGKDSPANASRVCIVNESLARRLFGGAGAVGRHLSFDYPYSAEMAIEIVGVVKDVHYADVKEADQTGIIYVPSWSNGAEARALVMRVPGKAAPAIAAIQRELRDMDPNVPLLASARLEDTVNARLNNERMTAYSCGCFGALALALAAVGLYGVMGYAVAQRTKEVGIRMALGAGRWGILGMMVGEALVPVLVGIAVGIGGGLAATGVVASLLFGVAPGDPLSFVFAVVAMLGVALLAAAIPARRASRVEPVVALRHE